MASGKALVAAILLLCFFFVQVRCDVVSAASLASPEQGQEIQMLRSKVASLEDEISGRKEETLQLETVVKEKSAQIAALVSELEVLQVTNVADDESVLKANTHNEMLEKQIVRLGSDLEDQIKKGESLEAHASEAEKGLLELTRKLDCAEKINMEQKQKIEELNNSLQEAKDKLSEVEREAKLKAEELTKVHGMWLPHWVVVRFVYCQELASEKWQLRGKPVLDALTQKVSENLAHAQGLVEPHVQTTHNKLVRVAKAHLNSLKNSTSLYASAIATRSTKAYRVCRDTIQPSMTKGQEFAYHHWKESKKFSTPYITKIIAASEPHISRAGAVIEPYTRPVISAWRRVVMSASVHHRQVQKGIKHFVNNNGLLKPDSADRLAWFTASALVALPMFYTYKMLSAAMWRKAVAAQGGGGGSSTRTSSNRRRTQKIDR
ncbi:hypothetical protein E2562_034879 [Oryza meyeriana var. granulata]|uniref:Uncharacterized protein n=1 Tax=Oryza meyeriana var. granulata TaxID=110450 RepID=A0A6G1C3J7_9ORYZ|nr:hypothetical protein E2562_034879 [Oryza meyeriana var. granulata]